MMTLNHGAKMSKREQRVPRVCIFWLVKRKLIIDSTPVSQAEAYGDHLGHPTSHVDHWSKLQRSGIVPAETEYEEPPRGRVGYDKREERFWLRADRCILRNKALVRRIMAAMNLPFNTKIETDPHYRCSACLRRGADKD
jgi:hypothetical protein